MPRTYHSASRANIGKIGNYLRETVIIGRDCRETFLALKRPELEYARDRGLRAAGLSRLAGEYEIRRPAGYSHHLLLFTLEGSGWLRRDGAIVRLVPASVWLCPRRRPQAYGLAGKRWTILWFGLGEGEPWDRIAALGEQVRSARQAHGLAWLFEALVAEMQTPARPDTTRAVQCLTELLLLRLERELTGGDAPRPESEVRLSLERLWDCIRRDLQRDWTVPELAALSGLSVSPEHFIKVCRREAGITPSAMVARLRMERAGELLTQAGYPVHAVAPLVGYRNAFAFSTAFRRWAGMPPRQYRAGKDPAACGNS